MLQRHYPCAYDSKIAKRYVGSPMLLALYGVSGLGSDGGTGNFLWICWSAATAISAQGDLTKRWGTMKTCFRSNLRPGLSLRIRRVLTKPDIGIFENSAGAGDQKAWCKGPVVLPAGWRSIKIDRLWIRGKPWRLSATQGSRGQAGAYRAPGSDVEASVRNF